MSRKLLIMSILAMLGAQGMSAQTFEDLLRYSQKFYQGDARSVGVGNSIGAFGADPMSMSINPAGIGLYRKNEFSFGFGLEKPTATANYLNNENEDDKYNLNVGNLSVIIANLRYDDNNNVPKDGWVAFNFGIGFNRSNSFQSHVTLQGQNTKSSIADYFANQAYGYTPGSWEGQQFSYPYLAIHNGLIGPVSNDSLTYGSVERAKGTIQRDEISTRGSMNDICLTFGGNYSNRVYVGATLAFPTIGFHSIRNYTETHISSADTVQSIGLNEVVNTTGIGITANFGAIIRLNDYFRVGASIQLPSFYSMSDDYTYTLSTDIKIYTPSAYSYSSPQGSFDYSIVTPFRYTLSGAFIAGKNGFINLDYEYVDYTSARITTTYPGSSLVKQDVQNFLSSGNNIRIGGEYRFDVWALRAGLGFYSSPYSAKYKDSANTGANDKSVFMYSLGIGYHPGSFFMDFAYQVYNSTYVYAPYAPASENNATIKDVRSIGILTMGWKF